MKRTITNAVLAANSANAKKTAGPKTTAGKSITKRNAITHGFFAQELVLNDKEKKEVETMRGPLHTQLSPETALQDLGFEMILSCMVRCKLALRLEMRRVNRVLSVDGEQQARPEQPEGPGAATEWYLSGRQGLLEGRRLLEAVKQEFLSLGRIEPKWNAR